jgi:Tol biopolymer transport system component
LDELTVKRTIFIAAVVLFLACVIGLGWLALRPPPSDTRTVTLPSSLGLQGRLIMTGAGLGISEYDLASDKLITLYEPPAQGFVGAASVSPDGSQIVYTYAAPPKEGTVRLGYNELYIGTLDDPGSGHPLLQRRTNDEVYETPAWTPDGKYIFFGHIIPSSDPNDPTGGRRLERVAYPEGEPETIATGAAAPQLSPDGDKLTYLTYDLTQGTYGIYIADADGSNPIQITLDATFTILDKPIFSPDGINIVFTSDDPNQPAASSWVEPLIGIHVAKANGNIASDLWRIPINGGSPVRLTFRRYASVRATFSPDGKHVAFTCSNGIFVMNADGGGISRISDQPSYGSIEWIP